MDHDAPPGSTSSFRARSRSISLEIGDMQGTMESAVALMTVYEVKPFWSLVVTLPLFGLNSSSANCNGIGTHDIVAAIQQQKFVILRGPASANIPG